MNCKGRSSWLGWRVLQSRGCKNGLMKDLISHDAMVLAKSEQAQPGSAHMHSQCVELAALGLA